MNIEQQYKKINKLKTVTDLDETYLISLLMRCEMDVGRLVKQEGLVSPWFAFLILVMIQWELGDNSVTTHLGQTKGNPFTG